MWIMHEYWTGSDVLDKWLVSTCVDHSLISHNLNELKLQGSGSQLYKEYANRADVLLSKQSSMKLLAPPNSTIYCLCFACFKSIFKGRRGYVTKHVFFNKTCTQNDLTTGIFSLLACTVLKIAGTCCGLSTLKWKSVANEMQNNNFLFLLLSA